MEPDEPAYQREIKKGTHLVSSPTKSGAQSELDRLEAVLLEEVKRQAHKRSPRSASASESGLNLRRAYSWLSRRQPTVTRSTYMGRGDGVSACGLCV